MGLINVCSSIQYVIGPYWSSCVVMGPYGSLLVFMCPYGSLWFLMSLSVLMGPNVSL